jgi:predicted DNA-binding protein with PD1-like motif
MIRSFFAASIMALLLAAPAAAQTAEPEHLAREPLKDGMAPGLKATELSPNIRTFQLVFAKGDEVVAGLGEFAEKNHLTNAHFTAIGAVDHAIIGWSDADKGYKIERINEEAEVTSLTGNITRNKDGKPVVHAHCVLAFLRDESVHSGHLLEGKISLTMQLYLEDSEPLSPTRAAAN